MSSKHKSAKDPYQQFDDLYKNATKAFVVESLMNHVANESDVGECQAQTIHYCSTAPARGASESYSVNLTSSGGNAWGGWSSDKDSSVVNTSGFIHIVDWPKWHDDWYDWWWNRRPMEKSHYYWPSTWTDSEIKKILEEIRDSIKGAPNKVSKDIVSDNWPPSNVAVSDDGRLVIDVALAGFGKEDVGVELVDDKLVVTIDKRRPGDEEIKLSYIQRGIKSDDHGTIEFLVDPEKFDHDGIDSHFENGVLRIVVEKAGSYRPRKSIVVR
jgi:HSP20 family molecular chaperone IbpA